MSDEKENETDLSKLDENAKRYEVFIEHRKQLHDALVQVSGRYTQWIMTLSGGSLALSITYVEKLKPLVSSGKWLLVGSWIALCASLVASLLSLQFSGSATKKAIVDHDSDFENQMSGVACRPSANGFTKWTERFSWISTILFSLGVVLIAAFVAVCPPTDTKPETKPKKEHVRKTTTTTVKTKS